MFVRIYATKRLILSRFNAILGMHLNLSCTVISRSYLIFLYLRNYFLRVFGRFGILSLLEWINGRTHVNLFEFRVKVANIKLFATLLHSLIKLHIYSLALSPKIPSI